ncbi:hypothetical protein Pla175_45850 [Pirellulimonas nuda]|uniref:Phage metallopeptidase domain-containing protein n=1 Tax=Pirellulimonas nuda TaxID=2528009 RepID=A0A518DI73_9BACT|nr:hypothetical protein [Pirellulimonas nuda]QDU91165.1 hypothetical protein Pla175_45850 [Pirellulimonas nuda]
MKKFDFTSAARSVCVDMTRRIPDLSHIDMERVAVGFRQARKRVMHGIQASLTPLRFEAGSTIGAVRGRKYQCQRIVNPSGVECLYLLNFYLPRFLDLPFEEKLITIVHELWHVGPLFDGDLRRHEGRCYAHGASQQAFDAHAAGLARGWLALDPPESLYAFLTLSFAELVAEFGVVRGDRYPAPKLVPIRD